MGSYQQRLLFMPENFKIGTLFQYHMSYFFYHNKQHHGIIIYKR